MYKLIGGDQREYGPVSLDQIRQWIQDGRANAQTLAQKEGGPWLPLSAFPEFASMLAPPTVPAAAPTAPPLAPLPGPVIGTAVEPRMAEQAVQGAAVALLITGIVCALASLTGIVTHAFGVGGPQIPTDADVPPFLREFFRVIGVLGGPMGMVISLVQLALSALIIVASQKLRHLENYGLVLAGTIIAMLPCVSPCCCLGLPIGIWVLTVIAKPEVKAAFR